ncbi:MAG: hypothetical protein MRJ92_00120 [Nitrospira sp.]|nr:hypothetical protein [Nitrospira sp.]
MQTLKTAFPTVESFGVKGPWRASNDGGEFDLFGGSPIDAMPYGEFVQRIQSQVEARRLPLEAVSLLAARRTTPWSPGLQLTDDYTPYDLLIGSHAVEMAPDGK